MKEKARELRKNRTDAESLLWIHLRNRQLAHCKFRRQHVIGPYIVDFVCLEKALILEIDGGQHADNVTYDENRTLYLESRGYKVIRFWNNEVLSEIEAVLSIIYDSLMDPPSPQPSPSRERG